MFLRVLECKRGFRFGDEVAVCDYCCPIPYKLRFDASRSLPKLYRFYFRKSPQSLPSLGRCTWMKLYCVIREALYCMYYMYYTSKYM